MEVIQLILPYVFGYKFVMSYIVYILKKKKKIFYTNTKQTKNWNPRNVPYFWTKEQA